MNNKNPQQVLDQSREEFRRLAYPIVHSNTSPEKDGQYLNMLNAFFTSTLRAFLEAEIKHLEGMKRSWGSNGETWEDQSVSESLYQKQLGVLGYNQAIDDQISHLKELLKTKR